MADEFEPEDSPFQGFLKWLQHPGYAVRDLFSGNIEGAARQALQGNLDVIDALLPGDWMPNVLREGDSPHTSDLIGGMEPGLGKTTLDLLGDTLTDPVTYVPGLNLAGAGGKIASLANKVLPEAISSPLGRAATDVKRSMNWLDLKPGERDLLDSASAEGANVARAGQSEVDRIFGNTAPAEQNAVGEIFHGIDRAGSADRGDWTRVGFGKDELGPDLPLDMRTDAYLSAHPELDPQKIRDATTGLDALSRTQATEGISKGIFHDNGDLFAKPYLSRSFSGLEKGAEEGEDLLGNPSAIKGRTLGASGDVLDFLKTNPDVDLDFNALTSASSRAEQQAALAKKALLGKSLVGPGFKLAKPEDAAAARSTIDEIAKTDPDYGYRLDQMFNGMTSRKDMPAGWFFQGLHGANRLFKSAATYGVLLPRISFNVRNQIGGLWQVASVDGARGTLPAAASRATGNLLGAFDDGFAKATGSRLTGSDLTKKIDLVEQAFKTSGGSAEQAMATVAKSDPEVAEAIKHGVMDNFVSSEELLRRIAKTPRGKKWQDIMDMPAAIGQGLEQRMRLGTFLDLRKGGMPANEAARTIKDAYLDYSTIGAANRTMRDVTPFGAFISQTLPQQAKFLAKHPAVGVAAGSLFGQQDGLPKYDWISEQASIPTGLDEQGNPQYLTGTGIPLESLDLIPGFNGRQLERALVSNAQPLLKGAYSAMSGRDPTFGTKAFSYDKNPLTGDHSDLGRAYQDLAGTGLVQPLVAPLNQFSTLTDDRLSLGERALQFGTGLRFASVDPDVAERQQLEDFLSNHPEVKQYTGYFQQGDDPLLGDALDHLSEVKANLKKKRDRAKELASL